MLPLDLPNAIQVSETQGGTITLPEFPGLSLQVAPGSVTFPDGSHQGTVSVTVVHADKIPMTPNFGQQPRMLITVQPPGAHFDPPAKVTYPNLDGLAPGEVVEFYSFDHDLGSFVPIGTGSVSEDGTVVVSDQGGGITKGGWQCAGNPQPTAECEPVRVNITSGQPVMLTIDEIQPVTANGEPDPGTYTWTINDEDIFEIQGASSGQNLTQVSVLAKKVGKSNVRVQYTSESGEARQTYSR